MIYLTNVAAQFLVSDVVAIVFLSTINRELLKITYKFIIISIADHIQTTYFEAINCNCHKSHNIDKFKK